MVAGFVILAIVALSAPASAETFSYIYEAGFAASDVTPAIGAPLAGFGGEPRRILPFDIFNRYPLVTFFKPSEGVMDPIRSKALVIRHGSRKLLFLSLDVVGAPGEFRKTLIRELEPLGFGPDEIFVSATHTHNGPGALTHNWFWSVVATDRFHPKVYGPFVAGVLASVQNAISALEPAQLFSVQYPVSGIQKNRRGNKGHFDSQASLLLARNAQGEWIGAMANLAVHGTAAGLTNLRFSADVPGAVERELEVRLGALNTAGRTPIVLFVNGAEGDVAPSRQGAQGMLKLSRSFADQTLEALPRAREMGGDWRVASDSVPLGPPRFNLSACVPSSWRKKINRQLALGFGSPLPARARIWAIRWGRLTMMTWPGEPTTTLGLALKAAALREGAEEPWVLGLTNEHLAYFTTPEEFREGGYESCTSLYGAHAGEKIVKHAETLLKEMK